MPVEARRATSPGVGSAPGHTLLGVPVRLSISLKDLAGQAMTADEPRPASTCAPREGDSPTLIASSPPTSEPEVTPMDDGRQAPAPWAIAQYDVPVWPAPMMSSVKVMPDNQPSGVAVVLARAAPPAAALDDDDDDDAADVKAGDGPKGSIRKQAWTAEEDAKLLELVTTHGPSNWSRIAADLPSRIGKQCRERWHNHLSPAVKKEVRTHARTHPSRAPPNFAPTTGTCF